MFRRSAAIVLLLLAAGLIAGCIWRTSDPETHLKQGNPFDDAIREVNHTLDAARENLVRLIRADASVGAVERTLPLHGAVCRRELAALNCRYEKPYHLHGPFGVAVFSHHEFDVIAESKLGLIHRLRVCMFVYDYPTKDRRFAARAEQLSIRKPECRTASIN